MPSVNDLLSASRVANQFTTPGMQSSPESGDIFETLKDVGGVGLGAVASVGNFLDLPGSSVRDLLAGKGLAGSFDQWLTPLSDENRTTGRQLIEKYFGVRKNRETGITGWLSDPGEGLRDVAGFAAELVTDPFGPATKAAMLGTKAGKTVAQAAGRAHPLMRSLGRGVVNVFDKIPANMQEVVLRAPKRGIKALFNAPTRGVTNAVIQPMAEEAYHAAEKLRQQAFATATDLLQTAEKLNFHLEADKTLDPQDVATWSNPRSQLQVNAREQAMYRYLELGEEFNPSAGSFTTGDIVTIGDTPDFKEVEWVNTTDRGVQVKLVGQDTPVDDYQLKPAFMQSKMDVPLEIRQSLDVLRSDVNALHAEAKALGILGMGTDHDAHADYFPREKSNEEKLIEHLLGVRTGPDRRQFAGLTATLTALGGRDMKYKGFKSGTSGVLDFFADNHHQHVVDAIDKHASVSPTPINGVNPKIIDGYIGPRHIEPLADAMGIPADQLWDEAGFGISQRNTDSFVTPLADGSRIMENGQQIGQIRVTPIGPGEATLFPQLNTQNADAGYLKDALPHVERELQQTGVNRVSIVTTPEMGDKFWSGQGYRLDVPVGDNEKWIKDLYTAGPGVDPKLNAPRMAKTEDVMARLGVIRQSLQAQVDAGDLEGVQPGYGWWRRYDDLRDPTNQATMALDRKLEGLTRLDPANISRGLFADPADYDIAMTNLQKGREVYYGYRQGKKGKPATAVLVAPTMKAKMALAWDKFARELPENVKANPLLRTEATYDELHQSITRNYSDRIDRWMPELDENGIAQASDFTQVVHRESPGGWRKAFPDLVERVDTGKPLTKSTQALLRMDDDSLQALGFSKENIEEVARVRQTVAEAMGQEIKQDVSIPVVDRHRALAEEVADHIEKRVAPIFNRSAAISFYDYVRKNGAAVGLLKSMQGTLLNMWEAEGGKGVAKDITVKYDPSTMVGTTLGEALDEKGGAMFSGKVSVPTFLENTRQMFVRAKALPDVTDPDSIKAQIEMIKGIRAHRDVFEQMKTLNEIGVAADLPELSVLQKAGSTMMSWFKAGALAVTPATAVRDGFSSYVNAILLGDMNPLTALKESGSKGSAFARGNLVDPGDGIPEIEQFLAKYGRPSNPENRAQAFQALWAAHHSGGGVNPNVVKADANRMDTADTTAAFGEDIPNFNDPKSFMDLLVSQPKEKIAEILGDRKNFNPRNFDSPLNPLNVSGAWKRDKTGRWVQNSGNNVVVGTMNAFRAHIDTTVRATYVLDRLKKTKSLTDAFANSDRVLMNANPRNFTRFEHQYMKNLVPFYSFMRQSIPMFLKELAVNPGGNLGMAVRGTRLGQGDEKGYVPYQYQDTTSIPLGKNEDGSYKYLTSFGLMHEDAIAYAGNALQGDLRGVMQKTIASANPAIKWLIEYSTNTSLYSQGPMGGRRLDDLDPSIGRLLTNLGVQGLDASGRARPAFGSPILESIAAASPASRVISMAKIATTDPERAGAVEKVIRLMTGVRTENVSPEQIIRDIRDRLNAIQVKHGARPLTTVIGAKGMIEELTARGEFEAADELTRIEKILSVLRKMERDKAKAAGKK